MLIQIQQKVKKKKRRRKAASWVVLMKTHSNPLKRSCSLLLEDSSPNGNSEDVDNMQYREEGSDGVENDMVSELKQACTYNCASRSLTDSFI
jgi:hypothetical protein